ncbi:MAG TPA: HAD family hydrolase [Actinopolymorphaceae bacterium]|nr:HAD family hydrolase [Actinopolymorphaceae bacterium]
MCCVLTALFFDGDQTLWDFETVMRRALRATLTELRRRCPGPATERLTLDSMISDRQAAAAELPGETNLERLRLAAFRRTVSRLGMGDTDLAEHLQAHYLRHRFDDIVLYPDTAPALTALSRTYALGLLSNGNSDPGAGGLAELFAALVFAQDHGVRKPDRRLFDIAADEIGADPAHVAMVGDSLDHDVAAAQAAGWRGIWLNRGDRARPTAYRPDGEVRTLADLPAVLACLDGRQSGVEGR